MSSLVRILFSREHWLEIIAIVVVGVSSVLFFLSVLPAPLLLFAMIFGAYPLARAGFVELFTERKIGTELFITVAVIISIFGKEYLAGAVVLMIILIAEYIASVSGERARASIRDLIGQVPTTATVRKSGKEETIEIKNLTVGDVVLVRAGEKIPIDGKVVRGDGAVNQAPITGESVPQEKNIGSDVYAGTILESGALDIKVTKLAADTVFARIIALVEEAENREPAIQKFTDRIASWLIPAVFVFVSGVYFYTHDIKLIIALLIFMSPAELGLATPLVTISAIARSAREGILVKGGLYLEGLAQADTFVFDKTGTLTVGKPTVHRIEVLDAHFSELQLLTLAATADRRSNHPLARAILAYAQEKDVPLSEPERFEGIQGRGVKAHLDGTTVLLGNSALMQECGIVTPSVPSSGIETVVYVARNQNVLGAFHISDTIRPGAKETIRSLREDGVEKVVMLTGDTAEAATEVGKELGITDIRANLLPEDKIRIIDELQREGNFVAMVGDGINDAPALAAASVGIAMGAVGTESAMEAADIVLVNDDLHKIARAKAISRRAYRTIKENIFVGVGVVHVVGIALVLLRIIGPVEAAIIHLVPDTLVFINSTKLLRIKI